MIEWSTMPVNIPEKIVLHEKQIASSKQQFQSVSQIEIRWSRKSKKSKILIITHYLLNKVKEELYS